MGLFRERKERCHFPLMSEAYPTVAGPQRRTSVDLLEQFLARSVLTVGTIRKYSFRPAMRPPFASILLLDICATLIFDPELKGKGA